MPLSKQSLAKIVRAMDKSPAFEKFINETVTPYGLKQIAEYRQSQRSWRRRVRKWFNW